MVLPEFLTCKGIKSKLPPLTAKKRTEIQHGQDTSCKTSKAICLMECFGTLKHPTNLFTSVLAILQTRYASMNAMWECARKRKKLRHTMSLPKTYFLESRLMVTTVFK